MIIDVYLRLKDANPDEDLRLLMTHFIRVSNDLHGSSIASSHELAKGYTRLVVSGVLMFIPDDICTAHEELVAKRKAQYPFTVKTYP